MSTSVRLLKDTELQQILVKSQVNNAVNDLTGMLLYSDGTFVQVLEGNDDKVNDTYLKVAKDPRHKNIIKLVEGDLRERNFANWYMGFRIVTPHILSQFDAYVDPTKDDMWEHNTPHPAITILRTFANTNLF